MRRTKTKTSFKIFSVTEPALSEAEGCLCGEMIFCLCRS